MTPSALLALSMLGCNLLKSGGAAYFDDWACKYEPWEWYGDPVQAVLEADEDGEFDYDPPEELVTSREGDYDFEEGDLRWENRYLDDYYGVGGWLEGYGTIYDNGDVDLLYRSVFEDVLGEISHTRVRMEREDCEWTTKLWSIDGDDDIADTPSDDPMEWIFEIVDDDEIEARAELSDGGEDWLYERVYTDDLEVEATYTNEDGTAYGESTTYDDGTATGTQTYLGEDIDSYYELDSERDGSSRVRLTGYYAGTDDVYNDCEWETDYEGNGGGECTFDIQGETWNCDIAFEDGSCELDCGSNGTHDC